jgi:hypothetical protein
MKLITCLTTVAALLFTSFAQSAEPKETEQQHVMLQQIVENSGDLSVTVVSVTKGGVIAMSETGQRLFIYGLGSKLADGDAWKGVLYPTNKDFTYTTVLGAESKIHSFATSKEEALRISLQ